MRTRLVLISLGAVVALGATAVLARGPISRWVVELYTPEWKPPPADTSAARLQAAEAPPTPEHSTAAEARLGKIVLEKVAEGFTQPTDIQFLPGSATLLVVLEKAGTASWLDLARGTRGTYMKLNVRTASEEGLLGLAFHPRFADNGHFYVHYIAGTGSRHLSRIARWTHSSPGDLASGSARETALLIEVEQPYQNHNGGQLVFGPDGMLYIGLGDGGLADDPHDYGQNPATLLGKILRIDVDGHGGKPGAGRRYTVPADNPFLDVPGARPELWAMGLRNPWRFSFSPDGRLVVADVGQDAWEEIDLVRRGDNLGWSVREGAACFRDHADCEKPFVEPIHTYGRAIGTSVTGGVVYEGSAVPTLRGRYLFADFLSGRFFALELPARREDLKAPLDAQLLGRWPVLPSTFGKGADGEVYVAAFGHGILYRIASNAPVTGAGSAPVKEGP